MKLYKLSHIHHNTVLYSVQYSMPYIYILMCPGPERNDLLCLFYPSVKRKATCSRLRPLGIYRKASPARTPQATPAQPPVRPAPANWSRKRKSSKNKLSNWSVKTETKSKSRSCNSSYNKLSRKLHLHKRRHPPAARQALMEASAARWMSMSNLLIALYSHGF